MITCKVVKIGGLLTTTEKVIHQKQNNEQLNFCHHKVINDGQNPYRKASCQRPHNK